MVLDPRTLAAAFVLLTTILGGLLLLAWMNNRKIHALVWWGVTFCLFPAGIALGNLGQGPPGYPILLIANALVLVAYGTLYVGCRIFNERSRRSFAILLGPAIWMAVFPAIYEISSYRVVILSLLAGSYAAFSAWELWRHAPQRLSSQRAAAFLLGILAVFNFLRGALGLSLNSVFWISAFTNRWSAEMALFLVIYAPALAFTFMAMAKERIEQGHREAERALRESEEHYLSSVELSPQIPWTADPEGNAVSMSHRWCELTGMSPEEVLGRGWITALHPDDVPTIVQHWSDALARRSSLDDEFRLRLADGSYRWFRIRATPRLGESGAVIRWYGTVEDIHDRKLAEDRLQWAAYHDDLTGLPNRRRFQEYLQEALEQADRTGQRIGLLIMDLDDFKQVNDRFGHDAGDEFLRAFGERLVGVARATDTVARLGGDEFAVILRGIATEDDVLEIARSIQADLQEPLRLSNGAQESRTSMGGAVSGVHPTTADELLKQADLALYSSKIAGRGLFEMFRPVMREEAQKRASGLAVARRAVALDWIVPFYQPKVELRSGKLAGFEALLRWRHPHRGIQAPETIAPAFDDNELGIAIGDRMLTRVIGDMRAWLDAGLDIGKVTVNASPAEFRRGDYAERVLRPLREAGIPPTCFGVEVTETVFLDRNAENVEKTLRALSEGGISIALDDFGTGYASLSHLKQFPINVIKIDRSFVSDFETDAGDAAIVKAVLSLGQSLGLRIVAEGVETPAQALFLRQHGCDVGQGYHFGHPMPAQEILHWLKSSTLGRSIS